MSKYGPRSWSIATYDTAMRRADRAIRRGQKQDAAYWMKIADHAHRIALRARDAEAIHDRIKRALEQRRSEADDRPPLRPNSPPCRRSRA